MAKTPDVIPEKSDYQTDKGIHLPNEKGKRKVNG
jgi:hypothetical protein